MLPQIWPQKNFINRPSIAAETVLNITSVLVRVRLMPEPIHQASTQKVFDSQTQSEGVPSTTHAEFESRGTYAFYPGPKHCDSMPGGASLSVRGTTLTSPDLEIPCANMRIPSAKMPSSLVTNILMKRAPPRNLRELPPSTSVISSSNLSLGTENGTSG